MIDITDFKKTQNTLDLNLEFPAYIRAITEQDITESYISGLNDPKVNRFLLGPRSNWQTYENVSKFVNANHNDKTSILFGLFVEDQFVGTCRVHDITADEAYMGLAIFDKKYWGKGLGANLIRTITAFCIEQLSVKRVRAGIELENHASRKAFIKAGFELENSSDLKETWGCSNTTIGMINNDS